MAERLFYLLGGNGAPNFGDELMARAWIDRLAVVPGARIVLDCNAVAAPRAFFGGRAPGLEVIAGLKQFCNRTVRERLGAGRDKPGLFLAALALGAGFFESGEARRHPELALALDRLAAASAFHIFGGGYINTGIRPDSGFLIGLGAAVARAYGIPVLATGIGITPLNLDAARGGPLAAALAAYRLFEVRDSYGFDRLFAIANGAAPVLNGVDDSFLLPLKPGPSRAEGPTLHVSLLRRPLDGRNAGLLDEIVAAAAKFARVLYWNCLAGEDPHRAALAARLPGLAVLECRAMIDAALPVAAGDAMVTQRFHPHMVAARLGATGLFVEDGPYYFDKHHSILHLGSPFRQYAPGLARALAPGEGGASEMVRRDAETMARKAGVLGSAYGLAA